MGIFLRELERAFVVRVDLTVVELEVWSARLTFVIVFEVLEVHVEVAERVHLVVDLEFAVSGGHLQMSRRLLGMLRISSWFFLSMSSFCSSSSCSRRLMSLRSRWFDMLVCSSSLIWN